MSHSLDHDCGKEFHSCIALEQKLFWQAVVDVGGNNYDR